MRLVSLAALPLGAVPLVAAEEAEVAGGRRSCTWDEVLRTLRLDQEQSIPFCHKILTTTIVVSVTVTISDTTITTQTIRPTYTNVLVKTETSTVDDQGLIKRILAERDESDDYSNSLISQYPSSALSSACTCLCVDPVALVTLVSTQTTTTQTIPETIIIDTATEFETVTGPSTTTDTTTTTTTTTTVVVPSIVFPQKSFGSGVEDPHYPSSGGSLFQFKDDGHLVCFLPSVGASFAWYPGNPLDPAAPYEVPFNNAAFISPPLEYLKWTGDPSTYSLVLLTEPSFNFMQFCQFGDGDYLGTWAVGAALGSDMSCTEIPLAIEPRVSVETTFSFNIFYQDSGGVRQYLTLETFPPSQGEQGQLFLTITPNKDGLIPFSISYGHLTLTPDDFVWFYAYFLPSDVFQQEGGGATLIRFNSPSFVKFNSPGYSTYFEWDIDWEAYAIYPVIPGSGLLIMQICTHPDFPTGVWAIGPILFNEDGYTCTAVTLGIETILMSETPAPKEEFRIVYTPNGGTEQLPAIYGLSIGEGSPSKSFQISNYYAWSPNYQDPVGQEWGGQINFDPAANVPDPSYYFQFDEFLLLDGVNMLTVSSPQQQTIEFRVCDD
ncbi:hypothetical protein QBC37DRAFT_367226 [Rhypophila decipiens]|uniref:Uncharacterized protein n=1 Tax=Rhypophila decipiens TaxID=261697 RepID=A0AAN6YK38_9PEZI|nr:hypothetical protein QBC37DRAFT_367226 [Rhypophila decipiens]